MWIECTLKREDPVIVPIGNERYEFKPDAKGRKVCEVWLEDHIEAFLAVDHLYRPVPEDDEAPLVAPADPAGRHDYQAAAQAERSAVMPDIEGMKRHDMMAELKRLGAPFDATARNDDLRAALAEARRQREAEPA